MNNCPTCGATAGKVMYMGLPMKLCSDQGCSTVFGGFSWAMDFLPFNGWFFAYEGNYWRALWFWLVGSEK